MTKRFTRLALVVGAAAALAAPAAPAHAVPSCSVTIQECIDEILSSIAVDHVDCVWVTTFHRVCLPSAG